MNSEPQTPAMTGLLPCPFCGRKASYRDNYLPLIFCENDRCFGPETTAADFDDAMLQWNTRAALPVSQAGQPVACQPRVVDFDDGEISVRLDGKELRGWSYKDDAERRIKMLAAREYVEGWCDGRDAR